LIARVFVAPEFLYRTEQPGGEKGAAGSVVALDDWELASRLSYLIWSSVPDDELRRLAAFGKLRSPRELVRQAKRMLRDPKAQRMAGEFFGQWFGFYRFDRFTGVDAKRFPEFTESLRHALHDQAVGFFDHIIRQDRPVGEILFADYTFLDQRLSEHYGVTGVDSSGVDSSGVDSSGVDSSAAKLVRAESSRQRGGLLSLGAVLATTSAPRRTSPVKRGDWIMRRLLGTPVPRPPADAGSIPADDVVADGHSVKSRLAAHRRKPACEGCHKRIDPLGFALENYDTLGRWRTKYRDGQPVESKGTLESGVPIDGMEGLRTFLKRNEALFQQMLCRKLVGYAFGRSESIADLVLVQNMMKNFQADGRFSDLVTTIVTSRQFRYRRMQSMSPNKQETRR